MNHYLDCEAPICKCDPDINFKNIAYWCPGEKVCKKTPYERFQKIQLEINRMVAKGTFKRERMRPYTANELERWF